MASAYGIAVTATLAIDTILAAVVVRVVWKRSRALAITIAVLLLTVDLTFFAANTTKILHGGWFPIVIGIGMFVLMITWTQGRRLLSRRLRDESIPLEDFLEGIFVSPPTRVNTRTGLWS